jgi:hypothetical protein
MNFNYRIGLLDIEFATQKGNVSWVTDIWEYAPSPDGYVARTSVPLATVQPNLHRRIHPFPMLAVVLTGCGIRGSFG